MLVKEDFEIEKVIIDLLEEKKQLTTINIVTSVEKSNKFLNTKIKQSIRRLVDEEVLVWNKNGFFELSVKNDILKKKKKELKKTDAVKTKKTDAVKTKKTDAVKNSIKKRTKKILKEKENNLCEEICEHQLENKTKLWKEKNIKYHLPISFIKNSFLIFRNGILQRPEFDFVIENINLWDGSNIVFKKNLDEVDVILFYQNETSFWFVFKNGMLVLTD